MHARLLAYAMFSSLTLASSAAAQPGIDEPAPDTVVGGPQVVRPPEGSLRRGPIAAPAWVVYAVGGAVILTAAGWLAYRIAEKRAARHGRRRPKADAPSRHEPPA